MSTANDFSAVYIILPLHRKLFLISTTLRTGLAASMITNATTLFAGRTSNGLQRQRMSRRPKCELTESTSSHELGNGVKFPSVNVALSAHEIQQLDEVGFVVMPDFFNGLLASLRVRIQAIFAEEGDRAGSEFKQEPGSRRLANLVDKGDIFRQVIAHPRLMPYVRHVLGEQFKLSSLNVRSVNPYWAQSQPLHADMAAIADDCGFWVCNTVWMIDDITVDNGPLRAIPGSHHVRKLPIDVLADPHAPHPDEVFITGKAGTVIVMNAHMWHGGMGNHTPEARTALHAFYCRRDKPQQQYQKKLLREGTQSTLTAELRDLLAIDDPLNDALCARPHVVSGFLKG